uniref:INO80 complex subunit E n=1 Tax=Pygocentrus nattereri TaxID=42514 RepID=A0AAR2KHV7_PYGNA
MLGAAAALTLGLLAQALTASHPPLHCEDSFYRRTMPKHMSHSGLERRCHSQAGRSFTSLHHPGCQSSVYTALHLSHNNGWGKGAAEETDETWSGEDSHMFIPALLKRDHHVAPSASLSPLQKVDALTAELVESQVVPLCSKVGGNVYVQSGLGGLSECEAGIPWTAVCCTDPDGATSFSKGMVLEGEGDLKVMSVDELEKLVGIEELFSGGCSQGGHGHEEVISLSKERPDIIQDASKDTHLVGTSMDTQVAEGAEPARANMQGDVTSTEETLTEERSIEESSFEKITNANDTESELSESVLLYILSSSFSLLCAPLSPVISTLTNLPSQVSYVLQEDAAVLAAVPRDSLVVVRDVVCGVASGAENTWNILYQVVENGVGSLYFCIRTLVGTLLLSCQEGVTGTGTLMCDIMGLVTRMLQEALELGGHLAGSTGYGLVEYLGTMACEMGHQTSTVGRGLGTLVWRSQRGVGHLLKAVGAIVGGVVENAVENVQEAFGGVENVAENIQEVSGVVENAVENLVENVEEAVKGA